jgi:hypothetical protein
LGELLDVTLEVKQQPRGETSNVYFQRRIRVDAAPFDHRGTLSSNTIRVNDPRNAYAYILCHPISYPVSVSVIRILSLFSLFRILSLFLLIYDL